MMSVHDASWRMLPWYVTGRLSAGEARDIDRHLAECTACRAELEQQRKLCEQFHRDEPVLLAPQASLQKLMARIDAGMPDVVGIYEPASPPVHPDTRKPLRQTPRWLAAAAAVQAIVIAALLTALWKQTDALLSAPRFTTLSNAPANSVAGPMLRVVFRPEATAEHLQSLLRGVDAQIVAGPTEAGVYTLRLRDTSPSNDEVARALAHVRADELVVFAERISMEAAR